VRKRSDFKDRNFMGLMTNINARKKKRSQFIEDKTVERAKG
jgi:hypothetical protein